VLREDCGSSAHLARPPRSLQGAGFVKISPTCSGIIDDLEIPAVSQQTDNSIPFEIRTFQVTPLNDTHDPPRLSQEPFNREIFIKGLKNVVTAHAVQNLDYERMV